MSASFVELMTSTEYADDASELVILVRPDRKPVVGANAYEKDAAKLLDVLKSWYCTLTLQELAAQIEKEYPKPRR